MNLLNAAPKISETESKAIITLITNVKQIVHHIEQPKKSQLKILPSKTPKPVMKRKVKQHSVP